MDTAAHVYNFNTPDTLAMQLLRAAKRKAELQANPGMVGFGKHLLPRFKMEGNRRMQLHATKGWRRA